VTREGENANAILVFENFLHWPTQKCADLVNDLLTARLQQFENTALTEIPVLFTECPVPPGDQARVAAYVKGLQDWQAGGHEWHVRSSRYMNKQAAPDQSPLSGPTGIGTSAFRPLLSPANLGIRQRIKPHFFASPRPVGHLPLPEFAIRYPFRVNSHLVSSQQHMVDWGAQMGFFDSLPGIKIAGLWDEKALAGYDFALCAAILHPDADASQLNLSTDWLSWGTYGDDYFPALYEVTGSVAPARVCAARLAAFMPLDVGPAPEPLNAVERGLADLWRRTAEPMSLADRQNCRTSVQDMVGSWLWELANRAQHRIPDPIDYVEMRRKTFGSDLTVSLADFTYIGKVPDAVAQTRTMRELDTAAQDYGTFINDLFSYQKEMEFDGDIHNIVLVVENFLGIERIAARDVVANLMTARLDQFEHIVATDLPVMLDEHKVDDAGREAIARHVAGLKDWMAGILEWHRRTSRYTETELRRRLPAAPGLGTSAMRIADFIGSRVGV
jgi:germacradienol/geosmin synthase